VSAAKFPIYQLADFLPGFYQAFGRFNRLQIPDEKPVSTVFKMKTFTPSSSISILPFFMKFLIG